MVFKYNFENCYSVSHVIYPWAMNNCSKFNYLSKVKTRRTDNRKIKAIYNFALKVSYMCLRWLTSP